jgi:hypothetical protein
MIRWPLYVFEALFGIVALVATLWVWRKRGHGWSGNLVLLPWLAGTAIFAVCLLVQVVQLGWHDLPPLASNALGSNALTVAGVVSVALMMGLALWKRG